MAAFFASNLIIIISLVILAGLYLFERAAPEKVQTLEESIIAVLLALMTIVSFTQVVARYGFNSGWNGALEFTRVLFAWLILFGMSYGVKMGTHLGVDAFIRLLPEKMFRAAALFGALTGILYAAILFSADWLAILGLDTKGGAVDYWQKMYKIGIGMEDMKYPEWVPNLLGVDERVPRWVAYFILPVGLALLFYRCVQATIQIISGERNLIIASHEAEELVAESKDILKD